MGFIFGILTLLGGIGLALGAFGLIAGIVLNDESTSGSAFAIFISGLVMFGGGRIMLDLDTI